MPNYRVLTTSTALHHAQSVAVIVGVCCTATTALGIFDSFAAYDVAGNARVVFTTPFHTELSAFDDEDSVYNAPYPSSLEKSFESPVGSGESSSIASTNVSAYSFFGQIKLNLSGLVRQAYSPSGQAGYAEIPRSVVYAGWDDTFTFDAPNAPGVAMLVKGRIFTSGSLSANAIASPPNVIPTSNFAGAQVGFRVHMAAGLTPTDAGLPDPIFVPNFGHFYAAKNAGTVPGSPTYDHPLPQVINYSYLAIEGGTFPFHIEAELVATAIATNLNYRLPGALSAFFAGELHNTIRWGGIDSVVNANTGEPIEDWTITSESGFDYSRPYDVPEPASMVLLSFAMCAWLGRPRRRRLPLPRVLSTGQIA